MKTAQKNSLSQGELFKNIETAFRVFPETKTAVFESEDGDIFAFGHVDKLILVEDILQLWDYFGTKTDNLEFSGLPSVGQIEYRHAYLDKGNDFDPVNDDLYFQLCESGHPNAFPLTMFNY